MFLQQPGYCVNDGRCYIKGDKLGCYVCEDVNIEKTAWQPSGGKHTFFYKADNITYRIRCFIKDISSKLLSLFKIFECSGRITINMFEQFMRALIPLAFLSSVNTLGWQTTRRGAKTIKQNVCKNDNNNISSNLCERRCFQLARHQTQVRKTRKSPFGWLLLFLYLQL